MSIDDLQNIIRTNLEVVENALENIGEWNNVVPQLQQAKRQYEWMSNAVQQAPDIARQHVDEVLLHHISNIQASLSPLLNIPKPPDNIGSIITTSGTAPTDLYYQHIQSVENANLGNVHVVTWAQESKQEFQQIRDQEHRADGVQARLARLSRKLADPHGAATEATLKAGADVVSPVEAAITQRELLDQFKGELIRRCPAGKGNSYKRIADNLAIASPITKTAIEDSQGTYDATHTELSEIAKSRRVADGAYIADLLRRVEDHIWTVTSALDTNSTGVTFN
jgi:hypothetical protein